MKISGFNINQNCCQNNNKTNLHRKNNSDILSFGIFPRCGMDNVRIGGLDPVLKGFLRDMISGKKISNIDTPVYHIEKTLRSLLGLEMFDTPMCEGLNINLLQQNILDTVIDTEKHHDLGIVFYALGKVHAERFAANNEGVFHVFENSLRNGLKGTGTTPTQIDVRAEYRNILKSKLSDLQRGNYDKRLVQHVSDFQKGVTYLGAALKTVLDGNALFAGNNTSGQLVLRKKVYESFLKMYEPINHPAIDNVNTLIGAVEEGLNSPLRGFARSNIAKYLTPGAYDTGFKEEYLSLIAEPVQGNLLTSLKSIIRPGTC